MGVVEGVGVTGFVVTAGVVTAGVVGLGVVGRLPEPRDDWLRTMSRRAVVPSTKAEIRMPASSLSIERTRTESSVIFAVEARRSVLTPRVVLTTKVFPVDETD